MVEEENEEVQRKAEQEKEKVKKVEKEEIQTKEEVHGETRDGGAKLTSSQRALSRRHRGRRCSAQVVLVVLASRFGSQRLQRAAM